MKNLFCSCRFIGFVTLTILMLATFVYSQDVTQLVNKLMPAVVTVVTESGIGSGFIIDRDGYVFTNAHVVSKLWDTTEEIEDPFMAPKERITIILKNGHKYPAKLVGYDARVDIALVKIEPDENLPFLKLGDSSKIKIGEKIIGLGSPLGLKETATVGVVSHVGRAFSAGPGWEFPVNVIQTDAAINPGSSGGPMVNLKGKVIGINYATTAKWATEGVGFAIPINVAKYVKEQVIKYKKVHHGYLGISLHEISEEFATTLEVKKGILIESIYKNSPAERAGLKPGDVIVSFNKKQVSAVNERQVNDFQWQIITMTPGKTVKIEILRKVVADLIASFRVSAYKKIPFNLEIEKSPKAEVELKSYPYPELGFSIKEITELVYFKYKLPFHKGIWISEVKMGSVAKTDLYICDVVTKIDGTAVTTPEEFRNSLINALIMKKKSIPIEVHRGKDTLSLFLTPLYLLKEQKVVVVVPSGASKQLKFKEYDTIYMKLISYGINVTFAGIPSSDGTRQPITLISDTGEEISSIVPEILVDSLIVEDVEVADALLGDPRGALQGDDLSPYDGVVFLNGKHVVADLSAPSRIHQLIREAVKQKKIVAASGYSVINLLEAEPSIRTKNIAVASDPEYLAKIQKFNPKITGDEVVVDETIITSTGSKESYKLFAYKLINLLKKYAK